MVIKCHFECLDPCILCSYKKKILSLSRISFQGSRSVSIDVEPEKFLKNPTLLELRGKKFQEERNCGSFGETFLEGAKLQKVKSQIELKSAQSIRFLTIQGHFLREKKKG